MSTQGPFSAGAGANSGAGIAWTSPGNITASDDVYANVTLDVFQTSQFLQATSFGFTVPSGSTILGIKAEFEISQTGTGTIDEFSVFLLKSGAAAGNNKATSTDFPTTDTYRVYGGAADLWGTTWTAADINASNFGVEIRVEENSGVSAATARVDHVRITVTYATNVISCGMIGAF